jgi:hypothetical protein
MAKRSPRRTKSSGSGTGAPKPTLPANATDRAKAIHGLMSLLAEHSWIEIGLADIAERGGLSLAQLRSEFGSPLAILSGFVRDIDRLVLTGADKAPEDESPRERLFEVLMRRFEVLTPYKEAIHSLMRSARRNPPLALALNGMAVQSQQWMLTAAGIKANGPKGMIRSQGLALMFANVMRVWIDDDEADLARTMAALDRGLTSGQRWSGFLDDLCSIPKGLSRRRRRRYRDEDEAEPEAA